MSQPTIKLRLRAYAHTIPPMLLSLICFIFLLLTTFVVAIICLILAYYVASRSASSLGRLSTALDPNVESNVRLEAFRVEMRLRCERLLLKLLLDVGPEVRFDNFYEVVLRGWPIW